MKKAMIFGYGVSGISAEKLLKQEQYDIYIVDDKMGLGSLEAMKLLPTVSLFIKSPGVPYSELVVQAQKMNIEVIDEVELGYRQLKKVETQEKLPQIIAVTGTNGKTTVTSKISELLQYAGYRSKACGNIGKPFGEVILELPEEPLDYIVIELSSFQLENISEFKADIAMVINLVPDHIDRYNSPGEYYDTKFNICKNQSEKDIFLLNIDDKESVERTGRIKGKIVPISLEKECGKTHIFYNETDKFEISKFSLKGKHNLENIMFIINVGKILKIKFEVIEEFLYTTLSLEHRLEKFFQKNKTIFINDSKGTNLDSTRYAIGAYPKSILICGGKDKKLNLDVLMEQIVNNVEKVYLMGENRFLALKALQKTEYNKENIYIFETLKEVIEELKKNLDLEKENVVLFSPGTSSFDQFPNYIERGKIFKKLIKGNFE